MSEADARKMTADMLKATAGDISPFAIMEAQKGYKVVVFAHTHTYVLEKFMHGNETLIYANTGGCTGCFKSDDRVSLAEIEVT